MARQPAGRAVDVREKRILPMPCALAAGHPDRVTADVRKISTDVGVQVFTVDRSPNAADRALPAAVRLYAAGVERWWIASYDAACGLLPGQITVLSAGGGLPARALVDVAVEIRRVEVQ